MTDWGSIVSTTVPSVAIVVVAFINNRGQKTTREQIDKVPEAVVQKITNGSTGETSTG